MGDGPILAKATIARHPLQWLRERDRALAATRRAARTAIVMPAMFAIGDKVIGDPTLATFAAFGSFSLLLLVDFTGPMAARLQAQAALSIVGGLFVCLGTLASRAAWLAALCMAVVGFVVLFGGVVSSVLAGAATSLLLAFILPVSLAGPASSIPARLEGWGMASGAAFLAVALLWPAPSREPLRQPALLTIRALAARIRSDVAVVLGDEASSGPARRSALQGAETATEALRRGFFATPYRPTGLSTAARTIVRLVDELTWLHSVIEASTPPTRLPPNRAACKVKLAAASVLERGADLLDAPQQTREALHAALDELRSSLDDMERSATLQLPIHAEAHPGATAVEDRISEFVSALDPTFRAQELAFVINQIGTNIDLAAAAERRSELQRLLGRRPAPPAGVDPLSGTLSAAQERAAAHVEWHSVWMHNSLRGAVGLGLAVLVANRTGVQHAFWVVLGTLSVLRSNALSTGQNALRGVLGTVVGFVIGAVLLAAIGTDTTVLWSLLPVAILLAGLAPATISFAAGQAAFTLTLVILFNIVAPAGWRVGLIRVEDIALGCGVSVFVGLLFWPRGAAVALGQALAAAYDDSIRYLSGAVEFGMGRCDMSAPLAAAPTDESIRAAASARRLDDTFRGFLGERGSKAVSLAEVSALVTGVSGLRLAADAVADLWRRDDCLAAGDRTTAKAELEAAAGGLVAWYEQFAGILGGERGTVPDPLAPDQAADARLVDAVRHDLRNNDSQANATAVRMIWTGDHLDAVRRLQSGLVGPVRTIKARTGLDALDAAIPWRLWPAYQRP